MTEWTADSLQALDTTAGEGVRVLHVDDDRDLLEVVALSLERERESLDVVTATSAEEGIERLRSTDVECVVSDYQMPRTDGLAFLERVREVRPDVPFILYTGEGSEEIASEAISAGVSDYMQKGTGTDQYAVLANRIENHVAQYRARRTVERGFQALETAREGISLLDEGGRFVYVNEAYAEAVGYDREELIGESWEVLYPEGDREWVRDDLLPEVPTDGRWSGETVYQRRDGERICVDHALAYTDDGTLVCLVRDVGPE